MNEKKVVFIGKYLRIKPRMEVTDMREETNKKLIKVYTQWLTELFEKAPDLLGNVYSNPYYTSIPENWFESAGPRIMVVGEEGFGEWANGKGENVPVLPDEIEKIQSFNYSYLREQLRIDDGEINNSAFWRRFRKVAEYGVCCWTNIDKIHVRSNARCALSEKKRKLLHSVNTQVLFEEMSILNPTHIIFFGWYGTSLRHEFPELYNQLYPGGAGDSSIWKNSVVPIKHEGRTYIFTYHPSYRSKDYEEKVMDVFKETLLQ